jgi:uncharacterized protein with GYD domain
METYVILATINNPGAMKAEDAGAMMEQVMATTKALGINLSTWLFLQGHYDGLLVFEAPNAGNAMKFAMFLAGNGFRTETLRAFTAQEAASLLS